MKSLKIAFSFLAVALLAVSLSSFAVKSYKSNAFAIVCYKYAPPTHTGSPDFRKKFIKTGATNSLDLDEFTNTTLPSGTGNWVSITSTDVTNNCNTGDYVCAICFSDDRTLQQAVNFAADYFSSHATSTTAGFTHGLDIDSNPNKSVVVYLKSTDANF